MVFFSPLRFLLSLNPVFLFSAGSCSVGSWCAVDNRVKRCGGCVCVCECRGKNRQTAIMRNFILFLAAIFYLMYCIISWHGHLDNNFSENLNFIQTTSNSSTDNKKMKLYHYPTTIYCCINRWLFVRKNTPKRERGSRRKESKAKAANACDSQNRKTKPVHESLLKRRGRGSEKSRVNSVYIDWWWES